MANISVTCRNYSGRYSAINGTDTISVSKLDVVRAILTVGLERSWTLPDYSLRGWLHRCGIGIAGLAYLSVRHGNLCIANSFRALDMSEKVAISYWYGMAFAQLAAETKLNVSQLTHVDKMIARGVITRASSSRIRGDLIGRDRSGFWHVVEAKGRSRGYSDRTLRYAKSQASHIRILGGPGPATGSAIFTKLNTDPISLLLDDPDEGKSGIEAWKVNGDAFYGEYYRSILELIRANQPKQVTHNDIEYMVIAVNEDFCERHLLFGLMKEIYDHPEKALSLIKKLAADEKSSEANEAQGSIGPDGVIVIGKGTFAEEA